MPTALGMVVVACALRRMPDAGGQRGAMRLGVDRSQSHGQPDRAVIIMVDGKWWARAVPNSAL